MEVDLHSSSGVLHSAAWTPSSEAWRQEVTFGAEEFSSGVELEESLTFSERHDVVKERRLSLLWQEVEVRDESRAGRWLPGPLHLRSGSDRTGRPAASWCHMQGITAQELPDSTAELKQGSSCFGMLP
ncbi:hypothetical protein SRHO_G00204870 [Serrasalmus rhombeus]